MSEIDHMRIVRDVGYQAHKENKRLRKAKVEAGIIGVCVFALLMIDYTAARIMFTYLDPTLGDVSMGPDFLALTVPVAVIAIHLLVKEQGGAVFERQLVRLAGVGVVVFIAGMGLMLALVYLDASSGLGSQNAAGIQGSIGGVDIGGDNRSDNSSLGSFFSGISPIFFFAGMALTLFITVYATHRLLLMLEERYRFFSGASNRSKELKQLAARAEEIGRDIKLTEKKLATARKKLPSDPEYKFAQVSSAAIHKALHRMKKSLQSLQQSDDLIASVFTRKADIPAHIETREEGLRVIAEIRHQTTPYEILKHLGGLPPREED
ncbi:hypothetical protein [uncultured Cohaesibacter sp.]|uniref:hypothetical protein n=1 Tax=uncultured Cohaesibacter sp. TaxID=1002546 RepID=UPI00292DFCAE|nr:hypothetical protein [uncultured Cohaesibacter sp.]